MSFKFIMFLCVIIIFITTVSSAQNESIHPIQISGRCSRPAIPPKAKLLNNPPERTRFDHEEVVFVICEENQFPLHAQTLKCSNGHWIGKQPRCGISLDAQVTRIKIYDCDSRFDLNHELIKDIRINQTESPYDIPPNSYHISRNLNMNDTLQANGSNCYLLFIYLDKKVQVSFLLLDFYSNYPNLDDYSNENKSIIYNEFVSSMQIEPYVNDLRKCKLQHTSYEIQTFELITGWYYFCDIKSEEDYKLESNQLTDILKVKIKMEKIHEIGLEAVFLGGIYKQFIGNKVTNKPDCGQLEIQKPGVLVQKDHSGFLVRCNDSFYEHYSSNDKRNHFKCTPNGLWEGEWPVCTPIITCPGLDQLQSEIDDSVYIHKINNVYYYNDTTWVAVNYTTVQYRCVRDEDVMSGRWKRLCEKDGRWANKPNKCSPAGLPIKLTIIITVVSIIILIVFVAFVLILFRLFRRNVKRDLRETRNQIEESTIRQKINNDYYDDINQFDTINFYEEPQMEMKGFYQMNTKDIRQSMGYEAMKLADTYDFDNQNINNKKRYENVQPKIRVQNTRIDDPVYLEMLN